MIGKLSGTVDSVSGSQVILDVGGVGYLVACSGHSLRRIGPKGSALTLLIETHVREDAINLYGFAEAGERDWFRLLTTVQGVGAKVALSILSALAPEKLANAIAAQDKAAITEAEGVGPKLALRIVTELKDKTPAIFAAAALPDAKGGNAGVPGANFSADALSALVNLGYRRAEAFAAVAAAARRLDEKSGLDALIRASLAELSRGENAA